MPWITLSTLLVSLCMQCSPLLGERFEWDRSFLRTGEWYRAFSGHCTHFSFEHLFWDGLALLVLGSIAETQCRSRFAMALLLSASCICAALFWWTPDIERYRGLSGVDSAVFGLVLCSQRLSTSSRAKWCLWIAGLVFLAKVAFEMTFDVAIVVDSAGAGFVPVPLAHLCGFLVGAAVGLEAHVRNRIPARSASLHRRLT